jgi:hypothetical protein
MGRTVVEDTTTEALVAVLETNVRGVLVAKDELSGWVRSMDQYKAGGRGSDRQFWLSLWSNSPVVVDRKGKGEPMMVPKPWVSITGSIQPSVLPELASGRDDGLRERFLVAYPAPRRTRLSDEEISPEATTQLKDLYERLADLDMKEDEDGEYYPGVVPLSADAWEVFKELSTSLQDEAHAPGFPTHLEGTWSKFEAYLARLALILCLCRVTEHGAQEMVEANDVLAASVLVDYFKAHARRLQSDLHGRDSKDVLAEELARFLQAHNAEWTGEPSKLREELVKRGSEAVPERPDELSKAVLEMSSRSIWLIAERRWGKLEGKSYRTLQMRLKNGVDGVVGVDARH